MFETGGLERAINLKRLPERMNETPTRPEIETANVLDAADLGGQLAPCRRVTIRETY